MVRHLATIARVLMPVALLACGGGGKKPSTKVADDGDTSKPSGKQTEEDREKKRHAQAQAIIPDGSSCLPAALKEPGAPRLDLAAIGQDLIVCASDTDSARLLGPLACWKVNLGDGHLTYQAAAPLLGRGISILLEERCARGYCLPKSAKGSDKVAHMAWNPDSSKVAVLVGDEIHVFDAASKAHETTFSIRGAKGVTNQPTAVHWVGAAILVEGSDPGSSSAVWMFKVDGTPIGPIEAIGSKDGKPMSTHGGSFSLLDKNRVAVAEQGFSSMTIYEIDSSKRSKLVRKLTKPPCKNDELDAYWRDNSAGLPPKCKEHMSKNFEHLIGATAVGTAKSFLVMLRGPRLGEIAVLDQKTLSEKQVIKLPWCDGATAAAGNGAPDDVKPSSKKEKDNDKDKDAPDTKAKMPAKKGGPKDAKAVKGAEDPDAGGE